MKRIDTDQKLRILLIDDNPDDRLLVQRALRREYPDVEVRHVVDSEMFAQALAWSHDLVITDYHLGWTTGLDVLRTVKEHNPAMPVIMFTGTGSEEIAVEAMKSGLDDYVLKSPKHFARLPAAVQLVLERAYQRRQVAATEARFQRLFHGAPIGLFQSTPKGRLLAANQALVDILGYPDSETLLAQESLASILPRDLARACLEKLQREGGLRNEELRVLTYDGRDIWVRLNVRSVLNEDGEVDYFEGSVADVTAEKRAADALRSTRDRLEFVLRMSPIILYTLHPRKPAITSFISSNVSWLLGYEPEECLHDPDWWIKNVHPEDREQMLAALPGPLFTTGQRSHEFRFRHKDGYYCWIRDEVRLVRGPDDAPQEIVGAWLDITEQKRVELEIQRRTRHLEALNRIIGAASAATDLHELMEATIDEVRGALDAPIVGIWTQDAALMKGIPEAFRTSLQSSVHGRPYTLSAPQAVDDWRTYSAKAEFERRMSQTMEQFGIRASLSVPLFTDEERIGGIAVAARTPRRWLDDEIDLLSAVGRQIGSAIERLQLLARVQEQARLLQRIMDTAPDGILLLDRERKVSLANPVGARHLQVLGTMDDQGRLLRLGDRNADELLHPTPVEALPEIRVESEVGQRVFEVAAQPLEPVADETSWVLDIREVTLLREMQQQAEQQARLAAVGQLAAGIAHDFNNILGAILLFSYALETEPNLTQRGRERVATIRNASERASSLINQILDFSRKSMIERHEVDLLPFVKETVKLLQRTLPESIDVYLEAEAGSYVVQADLTRLQQALMNLAVNARDAMRGGGKLLLRLSRLQVGPQERPSSPYLHPGPWIRIDVTDTGEGIPSHAMPHIFEPFFTTKEVGQGTGLGLSQVYGIVKQHDGEIDVRSEVGAGTTISIFLPATTARRAEPALLEDRSDELPTGSETILLVEDNAPFRQGLRDMLEMCGYSVREAENGQEALSKYDESIDLVLSDMVMPRLGGADLYQRLKEQNPDVKMIILTGYPLDEAQQAYLEGKNLTWMKKPVTVAEISVQVRKMLDEE